jgi:predicted DCC family thiol-disulfide oxidoreductase YuxK
MTQTPQAPALVLFDGVCNLCNGAVQWLLARDRRERLSFASLQSQAARRELDAAGVTATLPDSIVLVENGRVFTRSDAVLRIAALLGLPWSLAAVARILPRPLRDTVYAWIARHRYAWFGKREACLVPTPALRRRFLDAGEPPPPRPLHDDAPAEPATRTNSLASAVALRFVLAYFLLYNLPFPLDYVPFLAPLTDGYMDARQALVSSFASSAFGVEITVLPNGSGDTTYNYIELVVFALVALLAAGAWTAFARGVEVGALARDRIAAYLRYALAATLLSYGWSKLIPVQMPFPGPDRLLSSYFDSSPMGLLWTFMGASPAYQMFTGLVEVVAGALLLWRRTALLGALTSCAVFLNVAALNYFYDVPVKLYSSHLLATSVLLAAPHLPRLAGLLLFNLPVAPVELDPHPFRRRWVRVLHRVAQGAFVFVVGVQPLFENLAWFERTHPAAAQEKPWHGYWSVERFERDGVDGSQLEPAQRWMRVGLNGAGSGAVQRADGRVRRQRMEVDPDKGELAVRRSDAPEPVVLKFSQPEPDRIELEGDYDGARIRVTLRREEQAQPLLTTRGFHWINEYPLNR